MCRRRFYLGENEPKKSETLHGDYYEGEETVIQRFIYYQLTDSPTTNLTWKFKTLPRDPSS